MKRPRLLIEEWLPAAAIGVECMRERGSASALAPHTFLHVWWARRPLTVSRAAVLGSLLPADFPRDVFERLLGFGRPGSELVQLRRIMDSGVRLGGFPCKRAFKNGVSSENLVLLERETTRLWGDTITVIDPMAGGGSIPLESARLGFRTLANEYNPVACSVLEATVDYPFRFGAELGAKARRWGQILRKRFNDRVERLFPKTGVLDRPDGYIFARTVDCPDTQHATPLVPDWHLLNPKGGGKRVVAQPVVDEKKGTWTVRIRDVGDRAGQLREPPQPTYGDGKGISLFTHRQVSADYIKAKAQAGEMKSALYAVVIKTPQGLTFQPPELEDVKVLKEAEKELARLRPGWERANIIPTELYPEVSSDERPRLYGMPRWADMFSPRQLLCFGVLVEELRKLHGEIFKTEGRELGEAVVHLLALVVDKFSNYNSVLASWHAPRSVIQRFRKRRKRSCEVGD